MVGNIEDITRIILELAYRYQRNFFLLLPKYMKKTPNIHILKARTGCLEIRLFTVWCFATTKALDEQLCFAYVKKGASSHSRHFLMYGPRQTYA